MDRVQSLLVTIAFLLLLASCGCEPKPVAVRILEAEEDLELEDLWPGFEPLSVPVAIFDGQATFLARHPAPPRSFAAVPGLDDVWVYPGRHHEVVANTSAEIGGMRTAVLTLDITGLESLERTAAIVVHESFHVFQRTHHPDWGANEVEAFTYPVEDTIGLAFRRMEVEALRRAVEAIGEDDVRGWIGEAMDIRRQRFDRLTDGQIGYERGLELVEGTASYVEGRSLGRVALPPLDGTGYGAQEIRPRAYGTGRAMCMVLDRLAPGWKAALTDSPTVFLDVFLTEVVEAAEAPARSLPEDWIWSVHRLAAVDVQKLLDEREDLRRSFLETVEWAFEIIVEDPANAFWPTDFDPMNVQRLRQGEVLHQRMLRLSGEAGEFEMINHSALTVAFGDHPMFSGIRRILVTGLEEQPAVSLDRGKLLIDAEGLHASLQNAGVSLEGKTLRIGI